MAAGHQEAELRTSDCHDYDKPGLLQAVGWSLPGNSCRLHAGMAWVARFGGTAA